MSTNHETNESTAQAQALSDLLTNRFLTVTKAKYAVTLPDYFPREISLDAIRESLTQAGAAHAWTPEDVDRFMAHQCLSQMVIGFRARVESFASKHAKAGVNEAQVKTKVEAHDWTSFFPSRAGKARLTQADKDAKGLADLASRYSLDELMAMVAATKK